MFHKSVSKFGLATHLSLAAALPAALAQFVTEHMLAVAMLWTALLAWIWILFEPSVFAGETVSRARARVLGKMLRDPFAWFLLVGTLFAFVRWLNSGIDLFYDAEKTIWLVKDAAVSIMPASSKEAAFLPFATITVLSTVIVGVRHALGKNARIWFGVVTGAFSAIGGLAAVICVAFGVESIKEAALLSFGASWFYGSAYAFILPMAIACGIEAEERGITKARLLFAFAVAGNSVAAFVFLPIILSLSYLGISVAVAVASLAFCKKRAGAAACARAASMFAFGVIGAVSAVIVPSYKTVISEKMNGLKIESAFTQELADRNDALKRVSFAMWKDRQWGGIGVGAFELQAPFYIQNEEWSVLPPDPKHSMNGIFTVLAERGIIGILFVVSGIGFLLFYWANGLVASLKWHQAQEEGRAWLFCVPTVVFAGIAVFVAFVVDAWFSLGFPLTALPVAAGSVMVLSAASFPRPKKKHT
ncbi:MAG: O-antigen ligase family protein [Kiritimatiellae bacterium]|nr:O-antigen ligase family protein [Kiritimatiellia bacterium]